MRGVSKQHQPLNIRELVPEGTPAPPQAMSLWVVLTLLTADRQAQTGHIQRQWQTV